MDLCAVPDPSTVLPSPTKVRAVLRVFELNYQNGCRLYCPSIFKAASQCFWTRFVTVGLEPTVA
jgi:hypothetical protein